MIEEAVGFRSNVSSIVQVHVIITLTAMAEECDFAEAVNTALFKPNADGQVVLGSIFADFAEMWGESGKNKYTILTKH